MNNGASGPGPVSKWARVLAWLVVVASVVAAVGVGFAVASGTPPPLPAPWYMILPFAAATIWGLPLFWIVAFTGRPPRYWFGLGTQHWQKK